MPRVRRAIVLALGGFCLTLRLSPLLLLPFLQLLLLLRMLLLQPLRLLLVLSLELLLSRCIGLLLRKLLVLEVLLLLQPLPLLLLCGMLLLLFLQVFTFKCRVSGLGRYRLGRHRKLVWMNGSGSGRMRLSNCWPRGRTVGLRRWRGGSGWMRLSNG